MNKLRNFWENHKGKIIVGGVLIGTTAAVILIKKNVHFIKPADLLMYAVKTKKELNSVYEKSNF